MKKSRYWAFILYLDSAPNNYIEILQQTGIPFCVSPYHDRDINPDGSIKKPHYHIILAFNGPTTYNNVKSITDKLNCPVPILLNQVKGYYRYFTHQDNPEKAQYDNSLIQSYNGFDINDFVELTYSEVYSIIKEIHNIILSNNILEYSDLLDYLLKNNMIVEYQIAYTHTVFLNSYISSKRNKIKSIITNSY